MTAVTAPHRSNPGFSWLRVRTVVRRLTYVVGRSPDRWFLIFVFPFIDVILFGSIGAFVAEQGGAHRAAAPYLLAGIMLNHFLFQTEVSVATGFMEETWSRNVLNMMTTPLREAEYLVAPHALLAGQARRGHGHREPGRARLLPLRPGPARAGGCCPLGFTLILSGLAMGLCMIGLLLRYGQSAEIFTWATSFLVLALSGVFNPIRAIPGPLQPVSRLLPDHLRLRGHADPARRPRHALGRPGPRRLRGPRPARHLRCVPGPHARHVPSPGLRDQVFLSGSHRLSR